MKINTRPIDTLCTVGTIYFKLSNTCPVYKRSLLKKKQVLYKKVKQLGQVKLL